MNLKQAMLDAIENHFSPEKKAECAHLLRLATMRTLSKDEQALALKYAKFLEAEAKTDKYNNDQIQKEFDRPHFNNFNEP
jgi:hypothetical protein